MGDNQFCIREAMAAVFFLKMRRRMLKPDRYIAAAIGVMLCEANEPVTSGDAAHPAERAEKTLSPLADLIGQPNPFNDDHKTGLPDNGKKYVADIQPFLLVHNTLTSFIDPKSFGCSLGAALSKEELAHM